MNKKLIPYACTVSNLGAGGVSLLLTIRGHYKWALLLIVAAAMFDVFDGFLARMLGCTSEFGKQLDSLADLVSFGVAPVFLILQQNLEEAPVLGPAAGIVFIICGALRLARFNLTASSPVFTGMPITAAGTLLAFSSLTHTTVSPVGTLLLIVLLSYLMVSRISFPSLKKIAIKK
ncbi:CDP-diacylglycerol--serine O-phosphatidyltransferase [Gorillibacterium sp. CAU 1737]|uniref:CDP-diacylglycerol--serine O-phosphatidyltransferase n=1 Tax=Gorillibacterium sp. CAU 1737 TaxID=3140362 RepID=UPI0032613010